MRLRFHVARAIAILGGAMFCAAASAGETGPALTSDSLSRAAKDAGLRAKKADVDAPAAVHSKLAFKTSDYNDPRHVAMRAKYPLEKVVAGAKDEWSAQRLLRN